ncbi:gp53-like domain-containing protein [Escherichia coli]|uniref:gp53-like domain-containing protein n=1 Tax=Escherichia coli TaxID=562 RepID=UPI00254C2FB9|nr:hypothetical protein [Escherichia coli]HDK9921935.1 hypothetical protein [Escherichia coli]
MHRIDTKTAQKDKFGAGKNGFTRGNPQTGTPATDLDDDYFDMLQEELCSVVEASGASLEKGRHDQLLTALRALLLSRKNPFGDIKSDGTVQTALENLGLGTAATKNVGTGAGQIPDMTSFSSGSGWQRLPSGVIIQWGTALSGQVGEVQTNPFPIAFTDLGSIQIVATYDNPDAPNGPVHFAAKANTTSSFRLLNSLGNANFAYARWIAIGR